MGRMTGTQKLFRARSRLRGHSSLRSPASPFLGNFRVANFSVHTLVGTVVWGPRTLCLCLSGISSKDLLVSAAEGIKPPAAFRASKSRKRSCSTHTSLRCTPVFDRVVLSGQSLVDG